MFVSKIHTVSLFDKVIWYKLEKLWVNCSLQKHAHRSVDSSHSGALVQFCCSVVYDSLRPHGLWHTRLPCPSPTPGVYSNSCTSSWWCHPTISPSVFPFSSCLQSFPASWSFLMSQFFLSGGQSIGTSASASVLPINIRTDFL